MGTKRSILAIVAAGFVLAGCTGGADEEPTPTPSPTAAPSTPAASPSPSPSPTPTASPTPSPSPSPTTPAAAEDWTPPDPITEDYAARVLQELYDIDVATKHHVLAMAKDGSIERSDQFLDLLMRTRDEAEAEDRLLGYLRGAPEDVVREWNEPVAPWRVVSLDIVDSTSGCIFGTAVVDTTPLIANGPDDLEVGFKMLRQDSGPSANPTGWLFQEFTPESTVESCSE